MLQSWRDTRLCVRGRLPKLSAWGGLGGLAAGWSVCVCFCSGGVQNHQDNDHDSHPKGPPHPTPCCPFKSLFKVWLRHPLWTATMVPDRSGTPGILHPRGRETQGQEAFGRTKSRPPDQRTTKTDPLINQPLHSKTHRPHTCPLWSGHSASLLVLLSRNSRENSEP